MKKILYTTITIGITLLCVTALAQQNKCSTMQNLERRIARNPDLLLRMAQSEMQLQNWIKEHPHTTKNKQVIIIPVVVHVLWHDAIENIADDQILSQIEILNKDFRLLNDDSLSSNHPFWPYTADAEIEFCLASNDPNGNATNGITRTYTDSISFTGEGNEKFSSNGGKDNWDPTKYLNLWVCNLNGSNGTLGYAAFPADLVTAPGEDGVVIRFEAFGNIGTAGSGGFDSNYLGRTATHEVGHWLNLRHIWGDSLCGDDFVSDTQIAEEANYGCPTFPFKGNNSCGSDSNGEMFMNYMDYVDDSCMNMFTFGQAARMNAALNSDRVELLTSLGCESPNAINKVSLENYIDIYPNPGNGYFKINIHKLKVDKISIGVYDLLGFNIQNFENISIFPYLLDINKFSSGLYYFKIQVSDKIITQKVIITK